MIGGGIGVPPMLQTAKEIEGEAIIVSGYRNQDLFLKEELESAGTLLLQRKTAVLEQKEM